MDTGRIILLTSTGTEAGNSTAKVNGANVATNLFWTPDLDIDFWLYRVTFAATDATLAYNAFGAATLTGGISLFITNEAVTNTNNPAVYQRISPMANDFKGINALQFAALGAQSIPWYATGAVPNTFAVELNFKVPMRISGKNGARQSVVARITDDLSVLDGFYISIHGMETGRLLQVENLIA